MGNVCIDCEVRYNHDIGVSKKGKAFIMGGRKDWYRTARGSGHYPLTFNFIFIKNDKAVQCSYCGFFISEKRLTRDHVYPKSRGGVIKTPSCWQCNFEKEDMLPIQFAVWWSNTGRALPVIPIGSDEAM
jgi:hypothetical protein